MLQMTDELARLRADQAEYAAYIREKRGPWIALAWLGVCDALMEEALILLEEKNGTVSSN